MTPIEVGHLKTMSIFSKKEKPIYAFIDASNLFYGGEKNLGWKIDYQKLLVYLRQKYNVLDVYYYGGIELYGFEYSMLEYYKPIELAKLIEYLNLKLRSGDHLNEAEIIVLGKHIQRAKFYQRLESFGYILRLKPIKMYPGDGEKPIKKANCDVDMTFDLMRLMEKYSGVVILSGDGDFVPVLSYLRHKGRRVTILARAERTAREIKQFAGKDFRDFHYLREILKYDYRK